MLEQNWGGSKNGDDLIDRTVYQWSEESQDYGRGAYLPDIGMDKHNDLSIANDVFVHSDPTWSVFAIP